jgi:hypothetical protein
MNRWNFEQARLNVILGAMNLSAEAAQIVTKTMSTREEGQHPLDDEYMMSILPNSSLTRVKLVRVELRFNDLLDYDEVIEEEFFDVEHFNDRCDAILDYTREYTAKYLKTLPQNECDDVLNIYHAWLAKGDLNREVWPAITELNIMIAEAIQANLKAHSAKDVHSAIQNYAKALSSDRFNVIPAMDLVDFLTSQDDNGNLAWKRFLLDGDYEVDCQ